MPRATVSRREVETHSAEETISLGREIGARLKAPVLILLTGDLGAGKTTFVRGLAEGLGIDPEEVSSPTFTLVHEYRGGRLILYHADLYRLEKTGTDELGLEEIAGVMATPVSTVKSRLYRGLAALKTAMAEGAA